MNAPWADLLAAILETNRCAMPASAEDFHSVAWPKGALRPVVLSPSPGRTDAKGDAQKKMIVAIDPEYFQIVGPGLSAERTIVLTSLRTFPRGFVGCFDTSQVQEVAIAMQTSPFLAFRLLRHLPRANFPKNSVTVREG